MKSATIRFKLPEGDLELVSQLVSTVYSTSLNGVKPELILRVDNEVEIDLQVEDSKLVYEYIRQLINGLKLSDVQIEESPNKVKATGLKGRRKIDIEVDIKKI